MSTIFVPPKPDQWQGPATQFTPPAPDTWQGPAQPGAQPYNFPKPTYQSSLPGPFGRMDEAVQDSIDWMADGVQRMIKANTLDEKLAGLHETVSGFFNTAGAPLVLQGLGTAPVRTAIGLGLGLGTQKTAETVLPALGAGPGATMAGSDIAGIAAGLYGPDVLPAVGRGVWAAAPDVAKGVGKLGVGAAMAKVPIPEALKFGAGLPLAYSGGKQVIKGFGKGFRAALTAPEAVEAAPATPEPAPYTPGGPGYPSSLAPEAAPEPAPYTPGGPGSPIITPPPEAAPGAGLPALNVDQLARDRFGRNFSELSGDQQAQVQQEYQGLQQPAFQGLFGQPQPAPAAPSRLTSSDLARSLYGNRPLTDVEAANVQNLYNQVGAGQAPAAPSSPRVMSDAEAAQVFPDVGVTPGSPGEPSPISLEPGDFVQWRSQGVDQFPEPRQIRGFSPDGKWAFVHGSDTGLPTEQLIPKPVDEAAAAPQAAPSTTGLAEAGGGMADAITAHMYDMLWKKVLAGDVTEGGQPSAVLQAARLVRKNGGLQTPESFRAFVADYARIPKGPTFQAGMRDLVEVHSPLKPPATPPAAPPAAPAAPEAPAAAAVTPPAPEAATGSPVDPVAWTRAQLAAGNRVSEGTLQRQFGMKFSAARKLIKDLSPPVTPTQVEATFEAAKALPRGSEVTLEPEAATAPPEPPSDLEQRLAASIREAQARKATPPAPKSLKEWLSGIPDSPGPPRVDFAQVTRANNIEHLYDFMQTHGITLESVEAEGNAGWRSLAKKAGIGPKNKPDYVPSETTKAQLRQRFADRPR